MELFQLRYAVTLAEYRNFSRAAEKLFITQPTLSQQIQKLEKSVGFTIFDRDSRRVTPTPAGEQFLLHAERVIQEFERLTEEVENIQNTLRHDVLLGASQYSTQFFSSSIPSFLVKFPQINIKILETLDHELTESVIKNKIDLAVVSLPHKHANRDKVRIFPIKEEYVCAILKKDHPLTLKGEVTLRDLIDYKLIFSSHRGILQPIMSHAFAANDLHPLEPLDLTSIEARIPFIMDGAITFALNGRNDWEEYDEITRIPVTPLIYSTLSLIAPKEKEITPAFNALINYLHDEISNHFEIH